MSWWCLCVLLLCVLVCSGDLLSVSASSSSSSSSSSLLLSDTFQNIKNSQGERLVLFYYSSDSKSDSIVNVLEKAAKRVRKLFPHFQFYKCDGDLQANRADFAEAQFNSGHFIFSSVPIEGILKYTGEVNVNAIVNYIQSKYLPSNEEDLLTFSDEYAVFQNIDDSETDDDGQPILRPAFMWFTETWCDMCKRLRPALQISATYFSSRGIDVLEVKCSDHESATEFCTRHQVRKFPTLILFTGESKHVMADETINVIQMEKFAEKHLTGSANSAQNESDDGADDEADGNGQRIWNSFQKSRQQEAAAKKKSKRKKAKEEAAADDDDESKKKSSVRQSARSDGDAVSASASSHTVSEEEQKKLRRGKFAKDAKKKSEDEGEDANQQHARTKTSPPHTHADAEEEADAEASLPLPLLCSGSSPHSSCESVLHSDASGSGVDMSVTLLRSLEQRIQQLEQRVKRLEDS